MAINESREDIVARVKERADIVQIIGEVVDLKKSGARHLGLCPFHGEKTPSFSVHSGQQFFHCFGCGESGDVFSFMMKYHNLDFPSALKELAAKYRSEIANPYIADERGFIDEVIDPAETRMKLIRAYEALETKFVDNPARKHGNIPL